VGRITHRLAYGWIVPFNDSVRETQSRSRPGVPEVEQALKLDLVFLPTTGKKILRRHALPIREAVELCLHRIFGEPEIEHGETLRGIPSTASDPGALSARDRVPGTQVSVGGAREDRPRQAIHRLDEPPIEIGHRST
jgi:hypothetical protein